MMRPVAGAAADDGGQVALSGIAHTQSAVHKNLDLDRAFLTDMRDLLRGKLPREHDAAAAERGGLHHALKRMDAHLRGGMDGHVRRKLPA